jgi:hypothetical protein
MPRPRPVPGGESVFPQSGISQIREYRGTDLAQIY